MEKSLWASVSRCRTSVKVGRNFLQRRSTRVVISGNFGVSMDACRICGNTEKNNHYIAREMMFGLRESFPYLECNDCGCVQLLRVPEDMSQYYPRNYYSLQRGSWLKTFLRHQWASHAFRALNPIGWFVTQLFHPYSEILAIQRTNIAKTCRILDVGGGTGQLILDLRHLGFRNVTCADPFIEKDIDYGDGVRALKASVADLRGEFDLIMLHHSYEHMENPAKVMVDLSRLLVPGGKVLIRIPVANSYAWKHYRENWVNLDAPRHLFLHTPSTIKLLAAQAGLKLDATDYEGDESQFWASEQYARDIPLLDPRSYGRNKLRSAFSRAQIREFRRRAKENNLKQEGDAACFYLSKPD